MTYYRLHGAPQMYYSAYEDAYLGDLLKLLRRGSAAGSAWCIFDNTALGHATAHALAMTAHMQTRSIGTPRESR